LAHSDQQLIDQFHETGRASFLEELLQRHLHPVRNTVFQMLLNDDVADDVTQEVFLRVVRGIDRFEGRSEFSTWLFRVTLNTVRWHLKNRGRLGVQSYDELPEGLSVSMEAPEGGVMQAELATDVQAALGCLSPSLRAAIERLFWYTRSAKTDNADGVIFLICIVRSPEARRRFSSRIAEGWLRHEILFYRCRCRGISERLLLQLVAEQAADRTLLLMSPPL